uniref:NADH-ubiquinone oxidoreductase chain 6 n=1 Tax=Ischnoptera deropeltiformis TaxID=1585295 RepID=A0A2P1H8G6_9NEOP|nr:NADH dehydrogenase subunit 6 [Ischnoptera deropeltiformis]
MILMLMSLLLSVNFTQMIHPLAMGLLLMMQTLLISFLSGLMSPTFWFSYILLLIFIGGMLVLFIYVTSLASNEMFTMSTKLVVASMMVSMIFWMMMNSKNMINQSQETMSFIMMENPLLNMSTKLYNQPTSIITVMMASYLFLSLIAVVKITNIFKGPLRQMN